MGVASTSPGPSMQASTAFRGGGSPPGGRQSGQSPGHGHGPALLQGSHPGQQRPGGFRGHAGTQADESSAVAAFLRDAGLEQYAARLRWSGFDDMETLLAIEDSDMKDLGIPPYHSERLRKKLQEIQRQQGARGRADFDPNHPVAIFLEDVGLGQYAEALLRSGFDDMEVLVEIEDADMKDLGIPRGHALKLKKRLREHQLNQYAQEEPVHIHLATSRHPRAPAVPVPQKAVGQISAAALQAMPTEGMKSTVERSWEQVQALGTYTVGEILYRHTFAIMPEAIHLFPSHVRMKYREWSPDEGQDESNVYESPALRKLFSKFVNAVGCAVAGLHDSSKLVPMLTQLGARHVNYGVNEAHWEALGKAFNVTLRDILREGFTQEVEAAWKMAYSFMSSIMIEGFRGAITARDVANGRLSLGLREGGDKGSQSGASTGQGSGAAEDLLDFPSEGTSGTGVESGFSIGVGNQGL